MNTRRLVRQRNRLERQRLADLRERYVAGELDLDQLRLHVEQVLRDYPGLPVSAADTMRRWEGLVSGLLAKASLPSTIELGGMGFVAAALPDGTTCACERCTAWVEADEWTFPWCPSCYANVDGKCA